MAFRPEWRFYPLAGLVLSGPVKAALPIWPLPIDLTVLLAAICLGQTAVRVLNQQTSLKRLAPVLMLFAMFFVGVFAASFDSYSADKVFRLFGLSFAATVAAAALTQKPDDLWFFARAVGTVGLLVALQGFLFGVESSSATGSRLVSNEDSNPINLARAAGAGLIVVLAHVMTIRSSLAFRAGACVAALVCGLVILRTFSQGPALGAAVGVVVLLLALVFHSELELGKRRRALALVLSLGCGAVFWIQRAVASAQDDGFGSLGFAEARRIAVFRSTVRRIESSPAGVGWGDFDSAIEASVRGQLTYPHNLVLEVWLEAGWLVGIALVVFLGFSSKAVWTVVRCDMRTIAGASLAIYWFVNSLVSADINGNRAMFAFCAAFLSASDGVRRAVKHTRLMSGSTGR